MAFRALKSALALLESPRQFSPFLQMFEAHFVLKSAHATPRLFPSWLKATAVNEIQMSKSQLGPEREREKTTRMAPSLANALL